MSNLEVDELLLQEAAEVLVRIGLDVETVVHITLKRVVQDGGISFLKTGNRTALQAQGSQPAQESGRISKFGAAIHFRKAGFEISKNITFASKNRSAFDYWANPSFDVLKQDWYLILNDWQKKELHLFIIPAFTLYPSNLVCRNDRADRIDLQICYEDPTFTDNRSKVSFLRFHAASINY